MSQRTILCLAVAAAALLANCCLLADAAPFETKGELVPIESPELRRPPRPFMGEENVPRNMEKMNGPEKAFMEEKISGEMLPRGPPPRGLPGMPPPEGMLPPNPFGPPEFGPPRKRGYRSFLKRLRRRLGRSREPFGPELPVMTEVVIIRKIPIMLSKLIVVAMEHDKKGFKDEKEIKDFEGKDKNYGDKEGDKEKINPMMVEEIEKAKAMGRKEKGDEEEDEEENGGRKKGMNDMMNKKRGDGELEYQKDDPAAAMGKGQKGELKNDNKKDFQLEPRGRTQQKNDEAENDL